MPSCRRGHPALKSRLLTLGYSRFKPEDIQPFSAELIGTILTKLESAGSPEKVAENDFMMKCKRTSDRFLELVLTGPRYSTAKVS